jgi:hypothetical protein
MIRVGRHDVGKAARVGGSAVVTHRRGGPRGPLTLFVAGVAVYSSLVWAAEPPAELNPFGPGEATRPDALPGYCELSDGTIRAGQVYLTRDVRLKVYDAQLQRQREIPLTAVRRIEGLVHKEWREKEWRFKENASDEKVYTGRSYPVREYLHRVTLHDGRTMTGPLAALVYVDGPGGAAAERFLLHKRQKGELGQPLSTLVYVRTIELGDEALQSAQRQGGGRRSGSGERPDR